MVTAGVVVTAVGVGVVTVVDGIGAVVVVPNVSRPIALPAIGTRASRGFPMLCIAKLDHQAASNFTLFESNCAISMLGIDSLVAEGIVVTL